MKPICNFILDSEHNDEYIDFTLICVYFYSVITYHVLDQKIMLQSSTLIIVDNLINWMKLVHSR